MNQWTGTDSTLQLSTIPVTKPKTSSAAAENWANSTKQSSQSINIPYRLGCTIKNCSTVHWIGDNSKYFPHSMWSKGYLSPTPALYNLQIRAYVIEEAKNVKINQKNKSCTSIQHLYPWPLSLPFLIFL